MRHAAIAQALLSLAMALAPVRCALIPPPCFALAGPVAQLLAATAAVALASVIADADGECLVALEADDLDDVELGPAGHAAGKAHLDNACREWEALSVTWPSFRLAASTAWPSFPGGRALPPRRV